MDQFIWQLMRRRGSTAAWGGPYGNAMPPAGGALSLTTAQSNATEMLDRETGPELLFRDREIFRSRSSTPGAMYEEPKVEIGVGLGS
jgi:hypothetical protein